MLLTPRSWTPARGHPRFWKSRTQSARHMSHTHAAIPLSNGQMTREEVSKLSKAGAIRPSHSAYASACNTVRKKDGKVSVVQDFRGLNALLNGLSGGLGNLPTIFDEMGFYNSRSESRTVTSLRFATRKGSYGSTFGVDSDSRRCLRRSRTMWVGS